MIHRYDFGTPLTTGAVVRELPAETGSLPFFTVEREGERVIFTLDLHEDDLIFGLGEQLKGINKRGNFFRSWNSDEPSHTEDKRSLYASHNLLIFYGPGRCFGVYFDDPGAVAFDLGFDRIDRAVATSENGNLSVYVIQADTPTTICREFRGLIGRSYLPPKWALGYIQSRWGYASSEDARRVVQEHRSRHIPLDNVCMDIDYMEDYKDFTWDKEKIPDLQGICDELRGEHARLIPIIDAGVKQEAGYEVCEEGLDRGYFCRKADGKPFVGAVWPGRSYFPDFLRPDVRAWFGEKYHRLMEAGVEGFWNDMNEPALFYSEEGLEEAYAKADALRGENLGIHNVFDLKNAFVSVGNSMADYRRFYHTLDGQTIRHDKVHNLYGAMMTRAAAEGFRQFDPDKRYLLFSRSSFIGAHRYGGVWQGDNCSWWSHLLLNLRMMPSLNMAGFLYCGADLGGFGDHTSEELVLRWLQLGVFTPLMRNHTSLQTRDQEIYRFSSWERMRDVLTVRYALLPYLYSELVKAVLTDGLMFRPLAFDFPADATALRVEDQVMLGDACMIAPVYEQNARGRHVYLPEDMILVRFRSWSDFDLEPMKKGHQWVDLRLHEFPLFIRRGKAMPMAKAAEYVDAIDDTNLTLLGWLDGDTDLTLYDDDGVTRDVTLEDGLTTIRVTVRDGRASAQADGKRVDASRLIVG